MIRMTLREAADRTARSITTLRRYIRSGKLQAELRDGRYGPEYFVSDEDLIAAGLHPPGDAEDDTSREGDDDTTALTRLVRDSVPARLYEDLQMKHEQLLVQYGMMRAGGLRALELKGRFEEVQRSLDDSQRELEALRQRVAGERAESSRRLREAELELEARRLENAALLEKVRGLEMLTRNAVTNETVDRRFQELMKQARRVNTLASSSAATPSEPTDH